MLHGHNAGGRLGQIGGDQAREQAGEHAQQGQDAHGKPHTEGDVLDVLIFFRKLTEEYGLRHLYEGGQRQRTGYEGYDCCEQEADISGLHRSLISRLVDQPL